MTVMFKRITSPAFCVCVNCSLLIWENINYRCFKTLCSLKCLGLNKISESFSGYNITICL
jgi:hypothetical protein